MADIFISYSSTDREKAEQLTELLSSAGLSVWIDKSEIDVATTWSGEIVDAIDNCKALIVLLSPYSVGSKNVVREVALAFEKNKKILPLDLEPVALSRDLQYHLAGIQRAPVGNTDSIFRALEKFGLQGMHPSGRKTVASRAAIRKKRLAVMPFEDQSPAHDNEWFADGMLDELITTLGSLSELHVNPRGDVIYYKKSRPKQSEIAAELQCRYIVEGAVQKSGEKIRIRVSLSDASEHKQLWSEKYDGTFEDVFNFQEETAKKIAEALKITLTPDEEKKIERKPTQNVEAYELWCKGKEHYLQTTYKEYKTALLFYEEALKLDDRFTGAYASVANTCLAIYIQYHHAEEWLDRAEQAMNNILEIEGETGLYFCVLSRIALRRGNAEEALRFAKKAVELTPHYPLVYDVLGFAYQALGNKKEAATAWEKLLQVGENKAFSHFVYLLSLHELKDVPKLREAAKNAVRIYERHVRMNPNDFNSRVNFATILYWAGSEERALKEAEILSATEEIDGHGLYNLGCFYINMGNPAMGMEVFRNALEKGYKNIETFHRDPDLDPVRTMPEFHALVRDLEERIKSNR